MLQLTKNKLTKMKVEIWGTNRFEYPSCIVEMDDIIYKTKRNNYSSFLLITLYTNFRRNSNNGLLRTEIKVFAFLNYLETSFITSRSSRNEMYTVKRYFF